MASLHGRFAGRADVGRDPRGHRRGFVEWRSYVRRYRAPDWRYRFWG